MHLVICFLDGTVSLDRFYANLLGNHLGARVCRSIEIVLLISHLNIFGVCD